MGKSKKVTWTERDVAKLPKWAQAVWHDFEDKLRIAQAAGRKTSPVEPDIKPPESFQELRKGFLFNSHNDEAVPACTSSIYHAYGRDDKTTSQGNRSLYSTRLLALRALRAEVEQRNAERLAAIDKKIEEEEKSSRST